MNNIKKSDKYKIRNKVSYGTMKYLYSKPTNIQQKNTPSYALLASASVAQYGTYWKCTAKVMGLHIFRFCIFCYLETLRLRSSYF